MNPGKQIEDTDVAQYEAMIREIGARNEEALGINARLEALESAFADLCRVLEKIHGNRS